MRQIIFALVTSCTLIASQSVAQEENSLFKAEPWAHFDSSNNDAMEALAADYKQFLRHGQHELRVVRESIRVLEDAGYRSLDAFDRLRPGDRFYANNRNRALVAGIVGRAELAEGSTISAAHIDSVRIELKANPLYEKEDYALFQTTYHGRIRNFQWTNIPLGLVGEVVTKDGESVEIAFGIDAEPYLVIPGLAPHVDSEYRSRELESVVKGEELDPVVASRPADDGSIESSVMNVLRERYGIEREDFVSAQLALVPAIPPADVGFDAALIGGVAHDDVLCSWASLRALIDVKDTPPQSALVYLAANEEVGSVNVMGARAPFLYDTMLAMLEKRSGSMASIGDLRKAVTAAFAVSSDTTAGVHPTYSGVHEKTNASKLGSGVVVKRYGRGVDPTPEVLARMRNLLDGNGIPWQTATYKVDVGGGGTLGGFLSDDGIDTVDIGVPILSMHSPWPLASKVDVWWLTKFFYALYTTEL